jgi:hypothetical protein
VCPGCSSAALANDYLAASGLPDRRVGPSQLHVDRLHDVSTNSPGLSGTPRPAHRVDFASEPPTLVPTENPPPVVGLRCGVMGWLIGLDGVRGPLKGGPEFPASWSCVARAHNFARICAAQSSSPETVLASSSGEPASSAIACSSSARALLSRLRMAECEISNTAAISLALSPSQ